MSHVYKHHTYENMCLALAPAPSETLRFCYLHIALSKFYVAQEVNELTCFFINPHDSPKCSYSVATQIRLSLHTGKTGRNVNIL